MKRTKLLLAAGLLFFLLIQFIRPQITVDATPHRLMNNVPDSVYTVLKRSCFDCHSTQTQLRWFDQVTPVNFMVADHIKAGRAALDFGKFDSLPTPQQKAQLYYALNMALNKEMPLPSYTQVHTDAKLSAQDLQVIKNYLLTVSPRKPADSLQRSNTDKQWNERLAGVTNYSRVKPSPNGITYIPDYREWKAISTSDRFDNGSMRIIYANKIAVEAIQKGQINPWPDGSILAKTAWQQQVAPDGTVSMGQFIQVEFMIKDARKYAATDGWGWARWKGKDLKPYGADLHFDKECRSCHQPVKNNDYVFTAPLALTASAKP